MLSHDKFCNRNYLRIIDEHYLHSYNDDDFDLYEDIQITCCGIRPPFHYYSNNLGLTIKQFRETPDILSSFK